QVRQYSVGRTHSGTTGGHGRPAVRLGFKTCTKPSAAALRRHLQALHAVVHRDRAATQTVLIGQLTPMIRGWTRYYRTGTAKASFAKLDSLTYQQLRTWALRRHSKQSRSWVARKYWRREQGTW